MEIPVFLPVTDARDNLSFKGTNTFFGQSIWGKSMPGEYIMQKEPMCFFVRHEVEFHVLKQFDIFIS